MDSRGKRFPAKEIGSKEGERTRGGKKKKKKIQRNPFSTKTAL